jgi:hypothetical protein
MLNKFILKQTCGGCPEAYDVYLNDSYIGYMRLRHGCFAVHYGDDLVYEANPHGDGIFEFEERDKYLNMGCQAIKDAMAREEPHENLFEMG